MAVRLEDRICTSPFYQLIVEGDRRSGGTIFQEALCQSTRTLVNFGDSEIGRSDSTV